MHRLAVYLDMDGVLADFDAGLRARGIAPVVDLNRSREDMTPEQRAAKEALQAQIANTDFYATLPPMPGAKALWYVVEPAEPIVLTAAPRFDADEESGAAFKRAAADKRAWIETLFGPIPDHRFICTTSARKAHFIGRKNARFQILVDDRLSNIIRWRAAGGIGVHHENGALDSIRKILRIQASLD